jgi:hypothetical protein
MTLTSARLVLKHHRFEVAFAALAGLVLAALALFVSWRLVSVGVPEGCFQAWLTGMSTERDPGACDAPVRAFAEINEEWAARLFAGLAILPMAAGLIGGASIVGRELEGRTAQTAWAITPSRRRWLARQVVPIAIVLLLTTSAAAAAGTILESIRLPWYRSAFNDLALHGLPVVGRAVAAFGIGLAMGAVLGRVLPAVLVGVVLAFGLVAAASNLHGDWIESRSQVIADASVGAPYDFDGILYAVAFQTADGELISVESAAAGVPDEKDPFVWVLDQHPDWTTVQIGVPSSRAIELAALDAAGFGLLGLVLVAGTVPIVDRRRPT